MILRLIIFERTRLHINQSSALSDLGNILQISRFFHVIYSLITEGVILFIHRWAESLEIDKLSPLRVIKLYNILKNLDNWFIIFTHVINYSLSHESQ